MDNPSAPPDSQPQTLQAELTTIERTASAAHAAIDRFARRADQTLRQVRALAGQARQRFQTGCKNYSQWEDECVEHTRERIRAKPLTAVTVGVLVGLLIGRIIRSR